MGVDSYGAKAHLAFEAVKAQGSRFLAQECQPTMPVTGASPVMRNRDNDYLEFVLHVNEIVAERPKPEFADALIERLS